MAVPPMLLSSVRTGFDLDQRQTLSRGATKKMCLLRRKISGTTSHFETSTPLSYDYASPRSSCITAFAFFFRWPALFCTARGVRRSFNAMLLVLTPRSTRSSTISSSSVLHGLDKLVCMGSSLASGVIFPALTSRRPGGEFRWTFRLHTSARNTIGSPAAYPF